MTDAAITEKQAQDRQRLHEMPQRTFDDLQPYFFTLDGLDGPLDWCRLFGNENPVEIDIGCGRGKFVVDAAQADSDRNYLGIETDYGKGRHGAKRLKKRALPNARILGGDVRIALDRFITPASVADIDVYFPDPWWKRRHKRRRLFTAELVQQMATALKPGGRVTSWTDVEEYFEIIAALMNDHSSFQTLLPPVQQEAADDMDYRTSFERKKRQAGETIYRGLWQLSVES